MSTGNVSGSNPFDPCRQWLGISALELDDPRKLLGLDSIDDPIRILQAAEARLARLQAVEAGPYEVARRALVARIEEARDRLLTAASASGMTATPAPPGGLAMPPSPTAAQEESPPQEQPFPSMAPPVADQPYPQGSYPHPYSQSPFYPPGYPPGPPAYQQPPAYQPSPPFQQLQQPIPYQQPVQGPFYGQEFDGPRTAAPVYRRSSGSGPLMLLVGALFTVVVALGLMAMQPPSSNSAPTKPATARQVARKSTTSVKSASPRRHPLASRDRPFNPDEDEPKSRPQDRDDEPPEDMTGEPAVPEESEPEPPKPPATVPPTKEPEPPMKNPAPPPPDEPDRLARIDDAVKQCLEALWQRDYDTAERAMKEVEGTAPDTREADRIAGWLQLASYAKGFVDYRNQAIAAVKPGDEYDVKSKKMAVVEVTDQALTVKVAGQLKTWQHDDLPGAVMQAIVESWFDATPANQLFLGAYHFTKPEPDLEKAEACWNKADAGGADASLLIPLLTDPVVVDALEP